MKTFTCKECRRDFKDSASNKRTFCSRTCMSKFMLGKSGQNTSHWQGGKPKCLDCGKQLAAYSATYCQNCSNKGERAHQWKGDKVGYGALHTWVSKTLGAPKSCNHCGTTNGRFEWANKSHEYKRDSDDWIRLCYSCHDKYDNTRTKQWETMRRLHA